MSRNWTRWRSWLSKVREYRKRRASESDVRYRESTLFDGPPVHINVYQTYRLYRKQGHTPASVVTRYLANAFEDAKINYRLGYGFEAPIDVGSVSRKTLQKWDDRRPPEMAKDLNLLLINQHSGGWTRVGGKFGVVGCGRLGDEIDYQRVGRGPMHAEIHAALHETAHGLAVGHDLKSRMSGKQHTGKGWNEGGYWHRTPTVAGNGDPNACGEQIESREHEQVAFHQYFADCAIEHFGITNQ